MIDPNVGRLLDPETVPVGGKDVGGDDVADDNVILLPDIETNSG